MVCLLYTSPAAEGDITFQFNDPQYSKQWNLTNPTTGVQNTGNARLRRGAYVKVAVLDTGYVPHPDLVTGMANGYDFVSDPLSARDGDGRDPNPRDEGDYAPYNLCKDQANAHTSTWHGTSVAGIIGARGNNRMGIVGVADLARVQPVRVLGRCEMCIRDSLRTDNNQVGVQFACQGGCLGGIICVNCVDGNILGNAGVAGGAVHLSYLRVAQKRSDNCMFAAAGAQYQNLHAIQGTRYHAKNVSWEH